MGMTREEAISKLNEIIKCTVDRNMIDDICYEIIEFLEAQEPKVMSPEEYKAWMDIPFQERDPIFHEIKLRRGPVTWWTNTAECSIENYGKTERCWTSRPSKKEMEATPWN